MKANFSREISQCDSCFVLFPTSSAVFLRSASPNQRRLSFLRGFFPEDFLEERRFFSSSVSDEDPEELDDDDELEEERSELELPLESESELSEDESEDAEEDDEELEELCLRLRLRASIFFLRRFSCSAAFIAVMCNFLRRTP